MFTRHLYRVLNVLQHQSTTKLPVELLGIMFDTDNSKNVSSNLRQKTNLERIKIVSYCLIFYKIRLKYQLDIEIMEI